MVNSRVFKVLYYYILLEVTWSITVRTPYTELTLDSFFIIGLWYEEYECGHFRNLDIVQ